MPIIDQSYRHWEGTFKSHTFRWWIITREGLRIILSRKLFLLFILIPPIMHFIARGVLIYVANRIKIAQIMAIDARFFYDFLTLQNFFIFIICVFGGSGLIANDLKNNSLQLYFSKPLTRFDYLSGKFVIIAVLISFVTLIPGVLLFLESVLVSETADFFKENYWFFWSIIGYSLILIIPTGFLILALSSMTKSNLYAAVVFAAILIGTPIISEILRQVFHHKKVVLISYWHNINILGNKLFNLRQRYSADWPHALLIILVIICCCAWILYRKTKAVEIVK